MIIKPNTFVVSVQALKGEPLHGSQTMLKMANAVIMGGAQALRLNSPQDISLISKHVSIPIIGLFKEDYEDSSIRITPTFQHVLDVFNAGANIVALDATLRIRPSGETLVDIVNKAKEYNIPIMADIATIEEALNAQELCFDYVGTTLSGYTEETSHKNQDEPDFELLKHMVNKMSIPVIAEGRILTPKQVKQAFEIGAHAVVVGGAITRPQQITKRFFDYIYNK